MKNKDLFHAVIDNFYDSIIRMWKEELAKPNLPQDQIDMLNHMIISLENEKLYENSAVKVPGQKGHTIVVKHLRGTPRPLIHEERMILARSWRAKVWSKIEKLLMRMRHLR